MNLTKLFSAVALVMATASSQAALVDQGANTLDTATNLQWLDLSASGGLSYNQVAAQFGSGGQFEGYRFATRAEVLTLFGDAGIPDVDVGFGGTAANKAPVTALMALMDADLWGLHDGNGEFGYFWTAGLGTGLLWSPPGNDAEATSGPNRIAAPNGDFAISYLGSALVRDAATNIPEPGGLGLVGAALLVLVGASRRSRRS